MGQDPKASLLPYEFMIDRGAGEPAEVLAVLCRTENEAIAAARMFAEDSTSVELWQGERFVWSSVAPAAGAT